MKTVDVKSVKVVEADENGRRFFVIKARMVCEDETHFQELWCHAKPSERMVQEQLARWKLEVATDT